MPPPQSRVHASTYAHIFTYAHTYTYTHAHAHAHTHTYTQATQADREVADIETGRYPDRYPKRQTGQKRQSGQRKM